MLKNALLIFIKNPELGKVKTRLARTVGDERALQIYQALLGHTRKIAMEIDADRLLFYSAFVDQQDEWKADFFDKQIQVAGALGTRMAEAFEGALKDHEAAVIIGSDCASLSVEIVDQAFDALKNHDFVIGPAEDGGYYLIGMKAASPWVFEGIEWSTETVFSETIKKIEAQGQSYALLPTLSDIDFEEDWAKYGWVL